MKILKGLKALVIVKNILILSNLRGLYQFDLESHKLKKIYNFKLSFFSILSMLGLPFRRLLRQDVSTAISIDSQNLLLVKNKKLASLNLSNSTINFEINIPKGSRPLNLIKISSLNGFNDGIYFGEYFSNPSKEEVRIFRIKDEKLETVFTFKKNIIDHIHNLIVDKIRNCIWILAGDFGTGASIFQARDDFKTVNKVAGGLQKFRSCVAFPIEEGLLYATDSQFEQNSINILYQKNNKWLDKKVKNINGPSIFGTSINDKYFFSSSVEAINSGNLFRKLTRNKKGPGILKNQSEIICGNVKSGFETVYVNEKDALPFILFQFGNILFPNGTNKTDQLIFTPVALKINDFDTRIIDLKNI